MKCVGWRLTLCKSSINMPKKLSLLKPFHRAFKVFSRIELLLPLSSLLNLIHPMHPHPFPSTTSFPALKFKTKQLFLLSNLLNGAAFLCQRERGFALPPLRPMELSPLSPSVRSPSATWQCLGTGRVSATYRVSEARRELLGNRDLER